VEELEREVRKSIEALEEYKLRTQAITNEDAVVREEGQA
jgi:hypothetical protein